MKVRLKRNLNTGQYRYKKTDPAGIEMPHITEIPTDDLPSDAEALIGNEWKMNKPDRAGAVEKELIKPIPVNAGLVSRDELGKLNEQQKASAARIEALEKENEELRGKTFSEEPPPSEKDKDKGKSEIKL